MCHESTVTSMHFFFFYCTNYSFVNVDSNSMSLVALLIDVPSKVGSFLVLWFGIEALSILPKFCFNAEEQLQQVI